MDKQAIEKYTHDQNIPTGDKNVIISAEKWAEGRNKEACDLSHDEILEFLRSKESASYNSVKRYMYIIRDWATYYTGGATSWNYIDRKDLESCVIKQPKIIQKLTADIFFAIVEKLDNIMDKFILLALYEGFDTSEIVGLREGSFNFATDKVYHETLQKWCEHSSTLMRCALAALNQYTVVASNGSIKRVYDLDENGKSIIKTRNPDSKTKTTYISTRLARLFTEIGVKGVTIRQIQTCGLCMALKNNHDGLPVQNFISRKNPEYKKIISRYGKDIYAPSVILKLYNDWEEEEHE